MSEKPNRSSFDTIMEHYRWSADRADRKKSARWPHRGERVARSDELDAREKQLKADSEALDDLHAERTRQLDERVRRLELIVKLCDRFVEDLMPDYVRLLKAEDETIDLLHRLRRVLGPKDLPPDLEHELRKREAEESGDTSARKAVFAEVLGEILHAALGKSADPEPAPAKPAKRKPKSNIEDIEDAVRDAVAEHEPDGAA